MGPKYWADHGSQMSHGLQMLGGTCPGVQQGSTPLLIVFKPPLRIRTRAAVFKILSGDHYTTTAHMVHKLMVLYFYSTKYAPRINAHCVCELT